jgi:DNA-binding protein YbaB
MSIEIRQLVVNANIQDPPSETHTDKENPNDPELLKDQIMTACREMIRQMHKQDRER